MLKEPEYFYEFDEFLLYPSERLLLRNGTRVNLTGKDFDVLVYLVKKQKRLVPHSELLNHVWDGAFVEEGNISTCISKIRKLLDDNPRNPKYIESIKGYGYRFMAKVQVNLYVTSANL